MIGLFDSGIGGLSVLKTLIENYPKQSFVYLGDTARLPYGTKSSETVKRYTEQNLQFLKEKGATSIVSACHSASSAILEHDIESSLPLFNVIEPACRQALEVTKNKNIGLIATQTTVSSGQYQKQIPDLQSVACPLLVPLVEAGWTDDEITNQIIKRYTDPLTGKGIDTLILGCTHFPLLKQSIQKEIGPHIRLIDPAETLSDQISERITKSDDTKIHLYLTDTSTHFLKLAQAILMRFDLIIEQVDL